MQKEINAKYDADTKRTFRFLIKPNLDGISGSIYISKDEEVPDTLIIQLKTLADEKDK